MKTFLFVTAVLTGLASAFVERTPAPPRSTALGGGFLDGESKDHSVNRCDTVTPTFTFSHQPLFHCILASIKCRGCKENGYHEK